MCGIAGVIDTKKMDNLNSSIIRMLNSMSHRGPDAQGVWYGEQCNLGHSRLAVIDLSDGGIQPKKDVSGRYIISFNGEIYNYKELKKTFIDYPFETLSDTEVILAVYTRYGYDTPKYITGQFAFAIWDTKEKELFFARDRMGEKPFYYQILDNGFIFASEIRALLQVSTLKPKLRMESLAEFLRLQSVQEPYTLLEGIMQLPAAHLGVFKDGHLTIKKYWEITNVSKNDYSNIGIVHQTIKNKLSSAVMFQMLSDVPLGAFLSGGIDSSAIVALMAEQSEQPIETFSVGFEETMYDESPYSNLIAKRFKTNHHSILLKANEFKDRLPEILSKVDNPSGDGPNTFIVSEAVKKSGLTVALSGLGGDELFAGYDGFKRFYRLQSFETFWEYSKGLRKVLSLLTEGKRSELLKLYSVMIADIYPLSRSVFSIQDVKYLLPLAEYKYNAPWHSDISMLPILSQYSIAELTGYTRSVLLKDTDQMSMSSSLEVRVPFFDHDLVHYVLGIPDNIKYPIYPKSLLVESLKPLLPDTIVHRPKMGFSFPWDDWMRGDLKSYCEKNIFDLSTRKVFSEKELLNVWSRYLKKDPNVKWSKIWLLVSLEQWLRNINYE